MTPAYEGDPETPKVVPKDRWFEPPAGSYTSVGRRSAYIEDDAA